MYSRKTVKITRLLVSQESTKNPFQLLNFLTNGNDLCYKKLQSLTFSAGTPSFLTAPSKYEVAGLPRTTVFTSQAYYQTEQWSQFIEEENGLHNDVLCKRMHLLYLQGFYERTIVKN